MSAADRHGMAKQNLAASRKALNAVIDQLDAGQAEESPEMNVAIAQAQALQSIAESLIVSNAHPRERG